MADEQDSDDDDKPQLSPQIGTPCDELDISDIFEGNRNSEVKFEIGDSEEAPNERQSSIEKIGSDVDSASSELEDIYVAELGVTPPRNLRRLKERIRSRKKSQERGELSPKSVIDKADLDKKKRDQRTRECNQAQQTNERAFQRQFKRNSLGNEFEGNGFANSRSMDIPSVKIESRNRYMSLKCTRREELLGGQGGSSLYNSFPKVKLTRSESDPRSLSMLSPHMPQSRNDFYRTFSLLIKIGAHARKQRDNQFASTELDRQNSEEHKKWQVESIQALWLELRAWHAGRTMEEQDQFLIQEREQVDKVLNEFINFNIDGQTKEEEAKLVLQPLSVKASQGESSNEGAKEMPPEIFITAENDLRLSSDKKFSSASYENHEVSKLGSSGLSEIRDLRRQLSLDLSRSRADAMCSGKRPDFQFSTPKCQAPQVKFTDELEYAINYVTDLFDQLEAAEHLYPNHKSVGEAHEKYTSSEFLRNLDALQLWLNIAIDLIHKLQLSARFLGVDRHDATTWQDWLDVGLGLLGSIYPEYNFNTASTTLSSDSDSSDVEAFSPSTPLSEGPQTPKSPVHRTSSNISQYNWTSTSRYRPFVDRCIKKLGLIKLGKRIGDILDTTLLKAKQVLMPEGVTSHYADSTDMPSQQWQSNIAQLENLLYQDIATEMRPRSQTRSALKEVSIEQCTSGFAWSTEFRNLGLPSFCKLFLFLARVPLDISHECIRLRLEHRPKGDPSDLSIRQLLRECKEVILGAVLVKDYYLYMVDGILGPGDLDHEQLENDIEEFEQDLQSMLKMYFEYLHNVIHMVQRLPQASKGLKNVLEEEWQFVKHRCQHVREGTAEGGTRFCVMAAGLLESTADFLDSGLDQCCSDLHDNTDPRDDTRRKVIETCRSLKLLFNEVRERTSKALGFTKKLRIDLENAAKFKIDVGTTELLSMLEKTGHVQVVVRHTTGLLMFVPRHVLHKKSQILDLLDACCGHKKKKVKPDVCRGYLLVMPSVGVEGGAGTPMWGGERVTISPSVDTAIGLADIQVDGLILVVGKSYQLDEQRALCLQALSVVVSVVKERTSSHQAISDSLDELQNAALSLRERIVSAITRANENLDVCSMFEEEAELQLVCQNAVETMYTCFNFGFEYQKEIARMVTGNTRESLGRDMLNFAKKWMTFVMEKCEKGRGSRPRWATQGLDFLTVACDPKTLNSLSETEFQELKKQINDCISHVVGSAEGGQTSSAYRPHSPAVGVTTNKNQGSSSLLRPFSFPASKSPKKGDGEQNRTNRSFSEPFKPLLFHSIADDVRGEGSDGKGSETEEEDVHDTLSAKRSPSHKDSLDYSNAPKMERVRHALRRLEDQRNAFLVEKGRVGKVSSKNRDITSELANISNRRVPFKWQRGFKIGEGQFGKVYTSVNLDSGDFMAMKQIRFHPNDHGEIKELADEIKNFEGIQHESLVKYYGVELHRDEMFIFMEYCADGTISDVAKLGLPETMIRAYTMQILVAVNVLHERGIIHRDIKGANIFLSENGLLKLGDFGSSIKLKNQSQTMHGEVMNVRGTVAYMAPEVITMDKGAGYGRAADIWSIGCVVVEMAACKPPWHECDNNWAIMFRVGDGGIPAIPETLSDEGQDFLYGCFIHDPRERPTANELMDHAFVKCC